jgi:hypothetical protein
MTCPNQPINIEQFIKDNKVSIAHALLTSMRSVGTSDTNIAASKNGIDLVVKTCGFNSIAVPNFKPSSLPEKAYWDIANKAILIMSETYMTGNEKTTLTMLEKDAIFIAVTRGLNNMIFWRSKMK